MVWVALPAIAGSVRKSANPLFKCRRKLTKQFPVLWELTQNIQPPKTRLCLKNCWTLSRNSGRLWHPCLGLLPFPLFPQLSHCGASARAKQNTKTRRLLWSEGGGGSHFGAVGDIMPSCFVNKNNLGATTAGRVDGSTSLSLQLWLEQADFWVIRGYTHT